MVCCTTSLPCQPQYLVICISASLLLFHLAHISGPIIRVTPHELHIRDARFFDEFYGKNLHLDKEGWDKRFGCAGGLIATVNAEHHKRRRAALAPMSVSS